VGQRFPFTVCLVASLLSAYLLSGCVVASAVGTTISAAGTVISTAADVTGSAVGAVVGDGEDDDNDD
jgi:hypothetical protein